MVGTEDWSQEESDLCERMYSWKWWRVCAHYRWSWYWTCRTAFPNVPVKEGINGIDIFLREMLQKWKKSWHLLLPPILIHGINCFSGSLFSLFVATLVSSTEQGFQRNGFFSLFNSDSWSHFLRWLHQSVLLDYCSSRIDMYQTKIRSYSWMLLNKSIRFSNRFIHPFYWK